MNDDELKSLWQQQPLRDPVPSTGQLISAMQNKTTLLRRGLDARDLRETWICGILVIVFGYYFFTERTPISRLGWLIVIGGLFFIAWKLVRTRRMTPPAPPGATIVESLRAELNAVRTQSRLLGSVLWWYLLPSGIGLLVATWGKPIPLLAKIPMTLFYLSVYGFIYWVNQWARSKQLLPLESQLESLLHSAETGEPLEETHVASLRPIMVSMAAADQVKPVDFKVAFWQLAIWGEIGFVGIWFFWGLGLSLDNQANRLKEPDLQTVVHSLRADESDRYSAVAGKVIELLNAADYAAVHKLYNLGMGLAFPLQETVDFYTRLAEQAGNIEKIDGPTGIGDHGWIAFRLQCRHGELLMSLALDVDDKISGIYFRPAPALANLDPSAFRLFSWRHLAWLLPFFLAGLVYSWLIQKTTERAVGISAVGIHLSKGQVLVLWDEIKEIRPMKFLNVQNLWLIRESGEKTLMHWTPLERHSDLKAAVEDFAPAVHPIRDYLPLLRRR